MRLTMRIVVAVVCSLIATSRMQLVPVLSAETLKNPRVIWTGSNPSSFNVGDFNGDGKLDIAYLDGGNPSSLHILLGNGDGTFSHGQDIQLPQGIREQITVADVNNDGRLDLLIGGGTAFEVQIGVLLGAGDGTFGPVIVSQFTPSTSGFADINRTFGVADFNGDGAVDLAVADPQNDEIYVLLGDNTGSFTLKTTIFNGGGPGTILTGDFNGDGHPDFLTEDILGADATVYLGNGDGTFKTGVAYTGPNHIGSVVLKDMDGDGHVDMVAAGFLGTISILHGNADGTFSNTSSGGATVSEAFLNMVAVADLNGDGILDLVVFSANGVSVLPGLGSLAYGPEVSFTAGAAPPTFTPPIVADFNNDGKLDVAVVVPGGLALLLGNGDGTLQTADTYNLGQSVSSVAIADFNSDHVADIAVVAPGTTPRVLAGIGSGKFNLLPVGNLTVTNATFISAGDFNGDGKADVLLYGPSAGTGLAGTVLFGNGNATFSSPFDLSVLQPTFVAEAVADLNHDGRTDILGPIDQSGTSSLPVLLGEAANTFNSVTSTFPFPVSGSTSVVVGDINHDGNLDAILVDTMQPLLGNGDGTFRLGRPISTEIPGVFPGKPFVVGAGDLDGDGNLDLVSTMSAPAGVEIFYGNGDGTFAAPVFLPTTRTFFQVAVADMDNDGKPDLVLADNNGLAVIHNTGGRSFGPEIHYLPGTSGFFTVADLNGDGLPDVVIPGGGNILTVLLSQAAGASVTGTFTAAPSPVVLGQPLSFSLTLVPATATGTVIFSIDNQPVANVPLAGGAASFMLSDTSAIALGPHTATAVYSGNATLNPATFLSSLTVSPVVHPVTITLTAAPNPAVASQTVHFVATVHSAGPVPIGSIAFHDGVTTLGSVRLDPTGVGVFDTALLSAGTHSVTAVYAGDANSSPGTSPPVPEVITAFATTTALVSTPGTPQAGATFTLSATVTSTNATPTGSVVFTDGTVQLGARSLDSHGVAAFNSTFANPGTHSFTAAYQANGPFAASTSGLIALSAGSAHPMATSTTLSALQDAASQGPITLTAQVISGISVSSGKVVFSDGPVLLGEAAVDPSGSAKLEVGAVIPGDHYITAAYTGAGGFGPSAASTLFSGPTPSTTDFGLYLSAASKSVPSGSKASLEVTVDPLYGFNQDVHFTCSTASPAISCVFQPALLTGGGTSQLTIVTSPGLTASGRPMRNLPWQLAVCLPAALGLILLGAPSRFRKRITLAVLTIVLGSAMALALGCGGRTVDRASAITVSISASSPQQTGVTHAVNLQVVVQPN